METTIRKWGNSLAVRLPKHIAKKLALHEGSRVKLMERKKEVVISSTPQKHPSFKERIKMIRPEHLHKEILWGEPRGKEIW